MVRAKVPFNAQAFLDSAGFARRIVSFSRDEVIFSQGDKCDNVMYIQHGGVKLSVLSKSGREAVVAMLGPGDFSARASWPGSRCGSAAPARSPRQRCS